MPGKSERMREENEGLKEEEKLRGRGGGIRRRGKTKLVEREDEAEGKAK